MTTRYAPPPATPEITDAEIAAMLASEPDVVYGSDDTPTPAPAPAAEPKAGEPPATPPAETTIRAAIDAALAPVVAQQQQLAAEIAAARNAGAQPDPAIVQALNDINAQLRQQKLDGMLDDEKVTFLEAEREAERTAAAARLKAAQDAAAQSPATGTAEQAQAQAAKNFETVIVPTLKDLAATHGISAEEAEADMKNGTVYPPLDAAGRPLVDAQGRPLDYDWGRYRADMAALWTERAKGRETSRQQNVGNGGGGRPGGSIPAAYDPWDKKYHGNEGQMILDAVRAGKL